MAQCSVNDILSDARCLNALNGGMLNSVTVQLWCNASEAMSGGVVTSDTRVTDEGDTRTTDSGDTRIVEI
jgi:hypothetical protein